MRPLTELVDMVIFLAFWLIAVGTVFFALCLSIAESGRALGIW